MEAITKYKKKEAAKLIGVIAFVEATGVLLFALVAYAFWYIWFHYTDSDVLYLCGYYAIFGSFLNLTIATLIESIRKYIWESRIPYIKRQARLMKRRIEDERMENS